MTPSRRFPATSQGPFADDPISPEDRARLSTWLRSRGATGELGPARVLTGGTQNVVISVEVDCRPAVLRRPPEHPRPTSNRTLQREMRFLEALSETSVPHPRLLWACPDPDVLGRDVFYFMELVEGFNPGAEVSSAYVQDPLLRRAVGPAMASTLAGLSRVDVSAVGLSDLRKPGFLARQAPQWLAAAEEYTNIPGYRLEDLPHVAEVGNWLAENQPAESEPGITHGDYQFANVMLRHDTPDVAAIIDWEMATVGDPMLDLGWLLACWQGEEVQAIAPLPGSLGALPGLASRRDLLAAYAEETRRDLAQVEWYTALAAFKLGVLLDGTWARFLAGKTTRENGERLHSGAVGLLRVAHLVASGQWSPRD